MMRGHLHEQIRSRSQEQDDMEVQMPQLHKMQMARNRGQHHGQVAAARQMS